MGAVRGSHLIMKIMKVKGSSPRVRTRPKFHGVLRNLPLIGCSAEMEERIIYFGG